MNKCIALFTMAINLGYSGSAVFATEAEFVKMTEQLPFALEEYKRPFDEVAALLGDLAVSNPQVELDDTGEVEFSRRWFNLKFNVQLNAHILDLEKRKNFDSLSIAHEYGHAIFELNLQKQYPQFLDFKEKTNPMEVDVTVLPAGEKLALDYINAFHEFFADVVAITTYPHPEWLFEITQSPFRDLRRVDAKSIEILQKDIKSGFVGDYTFLYLSRLEFWQLVQGKIKDEAYRKTIISSAFRAVAPILVDLIERRKNLKATPANLAAVINRVKINLHQELGAIRP